MKQSILKKLDKQLAESQKELQVDIPEALKIAREHGDLSENAEYKAAKERQRFLESRVSLLQKRISDVTSLDIARIPKDRSGLGSTLFLNDLGTGGKKNISWYSPRMLTLKLVKYLLLHLLGKLLWESRKEMKSSFPYQTREKNMRLFV